MQGIERPRDPRLVQSALDSSLRAENESEEGGAPTCWRASGLGSSLTGRYLARFDKAEGDPFDERTLRVFAMGWMIEDFVMDRVEKTVKVERQASFFDKKHDFSGHCDGLTDTEVLELKSCHSRDFWNIGNKYPPKLQHRLQLWAYLHWFKREEGRLVYISKDDMSIKEFHVAHSDEVLKSIVMKELAILNEAKRKKLPPPPMRFDEDGKLVELKKTDWQYKYSPYADLIFSQKEYLDVSKYE